MPLDSFSNAPLAAYSVWRRLLTSYSSTLHTARKTSGGDTVTTQAIPYAAATNEIDTAALAAFVGAQSWAITTVKDQTSGARDVVQASAANQPLGGTAGTASLIGTHHAADLDGSSDFIGRDDALGLTGAQSLTVFAEFQPDALVSAKYVMCIGTSSGVAANRALLVLQNDATSINVGIIGSNRIFACPNLIGSSHKLLVAYAAGTGIGTVRCWLDGVELSELSSLGPTNTLTLADERYRWGTFTGASALHDGRISEMVIWNADFGHASNAADLTRALAL